MKKTAILVIASTCQEVYKHYISTYWREVITYTNNQTPNLDIFLLFDYGIDTSEYKDIEENIIIDYNDDYNGYATKSLKCNGSIPGILSKTIYGFEKLYKKYDVFFRTNLSSMILISNFINFVENNDIIYSGEFEFRNNIRNNLVYYKKIGKDKSIKHIDELDSYPGNTWYSGCGYFINSTQVEKIIKNKDKIRYDIIDDVSMGLYVDKCKKLNGFTKIIYKDQENNILIEQILNFKNQNGCHIRVQHFPLDKAIEIWIKLKKYNIFI
jgi:hypothetical protein